MLGETPGGAANQRPGAFVFIIAGQAGSRPDEQPPDVGERQVLDSVHGRSDSRTVFEEYVEEHGLEEITEIFSKGVRIEVGDMLPSSHYEQLLQRVPPVWDKAFELNASEDAAVRASCVEFVLAGLHATDRISRSQRNGIVTYDT